MSKVTLLIGLLFFLFTNTVLGQAHSYGELSGKSLYYYIDSLAQDSVNQVLENKNKFKKSENNSLHFGTTSAAVWLKLEIENTEETDIIAEFGYPFIDTIDFYIYDLEGNLFKNYRNGSAFPFDQRGVVGNNFKFLIPPGDWFLVWRLKGIYNIQVPFRLHTWETLKAAKSHENLLNGIYIGFCIVIIAYNFFLYLFIKDHIFNYYILHVIATALITLHLAGLTFQYLWPNMPSINQNEPIIYGLGIFSTLFSIKFLQLEKFSSFWNKVLWVVFWVNIPVFILVFFQQKMLANILVQLVGSIGCSLMIVAGSVAYAKGYKPARFYILAFSIFLAGVVISILSRMNILPNTPIFVHASQFGSGMDIILLSIAVADKFNQINKQKLEGEKQLLEKTIENQKLTESKNIELEGLVSERTSKLSLANQKLEEQSLELKEINRYKDKVFTVIAHDLKGNISSIKGLLELTENSNDTLDKETLSALNETTDKTYELLNNLLTWGSLNKGDFRPINSNIYLKESILKVLSTYKPQFDKKSLQLNVNLSEDNFIIYADANYIEIVFRNLISNAIKFTPKGGSISLDLFEYKVAKKVVVKIKDSGVGMQTSKLSSLFESVSQKSTQGTDNEQGTGLGLVLVKEILDAMKADVQVESELNEGTTFTLKFDRI